MIAFLPDQQFLAIGSFNSAAAILAWETLQVLHVLEGGGFEDGLIKMFALDVNDTIALANERLTRTFSEAVCQRYLHLEACPVD